MATQNLNPNRPYIKIGRNIFQFEPGEYIMDNGSCIQYCVINGNKLPRITKWVESKNIIIPKKEIKRLEKEYDKTNLPDTTYGGKRWRLRIKPQIK